MYLCVCVCVCVCTVDVVNYNDSRDYIRTLGILVDYKGQRCIQRHDASGHRFLLYRCILTRCTGMSGLTGVNLEGPRGAEGTRNRGGATR